MILKSSIKKTFISATVLLDLCTRVKMKLLKLLRPYLNYFRFFGICLQCPEMKFSTKFYTYGMAILSVLQALLLTPIMYFVMKPSSGQDIINFMLGIGIFFTHFVIVLETLLTKNSQLDFWYLLRKLERLYKRNFNDIEESYRELMISVKRKIWIISTISCTVEALTIASLIIVGKFDTENNASQYVWFLTLYSTKSVRTKHMNYIVAVDVLKMHVALFNKVLHRRKVDFKTMMKGDIVRELNLIKFRHTFIWELCRSINICHLWSQFTNIVVDFFHITCFCYNCYVQIVHTSYYQLLCKLKIFSNSFNCD